MSVTLELVGVAVAAGAGAAGAVIGVVRPVVMDLQRQVKGINTRLDGMTGKPGPEPTRLWRAK